MNPDEFEVLCLDIAMHGLREPILLAGGRIADGRNRYKACLEVNEEPRFREWDGTGDLRSIVVSLNLKRRHLSESQRALVAANLTTNAVGRPSKENNPANLPDLSQSTAAQLLNVSERSVRSAAKVRRDGDPELIEAVEQGEMKISTAAEVASLSPAEQKRIVHQVKKLKKSGRRSQKKVVLGLKTQSLKQTEKGSASCLYCNPDLVWTDVRVSAFAQRVEQRAKEAFRDGRAELNFAPYFDSIASELEDEKRAETARTHYDKIFAVIDAGAERDDKQNQCAERTDIQKLTGIPRSEFDDVIAHMLDYNMIEIVPQGGKTDGARGARKQLLRRSTKPDPLEFEIDDDPDFPEKDEYYERW